MKNLMCKIVIVNVACFVPLAHSAGPAIINFDDIPLGTNLVNGQFGWYDWGTGGVGQTVVLSNTGNNASVGPGASSFVSDGVDSIHSTFLSSDTVLMEWDVELLGVGPSNNRGPEVEVGRDLDGDGILESGILTPPEAGYEQIFRIKINYDRIDIRYDQLDAAGIATTNPITESINFATTDTDLHCEIQIEQVNSHAMVFSLVLSGQSGVAVDQQVVIDFIGPHLWNEINGIVIRTDNCCSKVDNIVFTPVDAGAVQWRVEDGGNGHWYKQFPNSFPQLPFGEVQSFATNLGGHLTTLTSFEENNFVVNQGMPGTIGGYQDTNAPDYSEPAGGWRWVTGEPWVFTNWSSGEPNEFNNNGEDFLVTGPWGWNDDSDMNPAAVPFIVVEWSADCNGDGIVDYGQILNGELPDTNGNGVPDSCEFCSADLDGNGLLNFFDVSGFLLYFQLNDPIADFTGDGNFDFFDVSAFLVAFATGCP